MAWTLTKKSRWTGWTDRVWGRAMEWVRWCQIRMMIWSIIHEVSGSNPPPLKMSHYLFLIKWALLMNLKPVSSCYTMSWSSIIFWCPFFALARVPYHEKCRSLVIPDTLYHAYYALTCFSLLLVKLAQNFHIFSCPCVAHPPANNADVEGSIPLQAKEHDFDTMLQVSVYRRQNHEAPVPDICQCQDQILVHRQDGDAAFQASTILSLTVFTCSLTSAH